MRTLLGGGAPTVVAPARQGTPRLSPARSCVGAGASGGGSRWERCYPGTVRPGAGASAGGGRGASAVLPATSVAFAWLLMRGRGSHPTTWILGLPPDSIQKVWFLGWTGLSPDPVAPSLVTSQLTAPHLVNLLWNSPTLLLGVVRALMTRSAGPIPAYDPANGLAPALAATSMFVVLRQLALGRAAAGARGRLIGFAPVAVAEVDAGHLPWAQIWLVPVFPLLFVHTTLHRRRTRGALGSTVGVVATLQRWSRCPTPPGSRTEPAWPCGSPSAPPAPSSFWCRRS